MSNLTNSVKPFELINVVDPRLECLKFKKEKLEYAVVKGGAYSNYQQQKCNSYSNSGVTFGWNTQGANTIIDRRIYAKVEFKVTMTGTPAENTRLFNDSLCSPRAFPLAAITDNLTVTINGSSTSCQYADCMQALLRYNTDYNLKQYDLSGTPTKLDNYVNYQDAIGSLNNPLNNYKDSGYEQGRGSFKLEIVQNPEGDGVTEKTSIVKFTVVEPLFISPLCYSSSDLEAGLIGVNNMGINMNFSNNQLVWSQVLQGTENVSSFQVELGAGVTKQPELLLNYINVPETDAMLAPEVATYDFFNLETYQNDQHVSLPAGASQSFTNNAIQLSIIPRSIWIYCSVPRTSKTFQDTDSFFKINSLSLQYLNVSGQFSSATTHDLYNNLAVKNGCKMSFQEWSGETGSFNSEFGLTGGILRIDSTDLALPETMAPGVASNSQLQFTINITNQSNVARDVSIYVIVANEGLLSIANNSMVTQLAILDQESVLETRQNSKYIKENLQKSMYGGSFWSKIRHVGKFLSNVAKEIGLDKEIEKEAKELRKELIKSGKESLRNKIRGNGLVGGGLVGGRQMSRRELLELMD